MQPKHAKWSSIALLVGGILLTGCLGKGPNEPVWPVIPPQPTTIHSPIPSYLLSGKITGLRVRQVEALELSNHKSYKSDVTSDQLFQFDTLIPSNYQLTLVTASSSITLQKVVMVYPSQPVFLNIDVQTDPLRITIDGLPIASNVATSSN